MSKNSFKVLRPGINTTFQDLGRDNLYHVGLPFSGAIDKRNYLIANSIITNKADDAVLEFAYQGPLIEFSGSKTSFVITGNVNFKIIKKDTSEIIGECYKTYDLEDKDCVDVISTEKSVYGYLSIKGGFYINKFCNSYSTTIRAEIGPNNGKKIEIGQEIMLNTSETTNSRGLEYLNSKIEFIRVIKGTNFDYFSEDSIKDFTSKEFVVSKLTDRMGMRLSGLKIKNLKKTNIKSEGLGKGVIQVPADGDPIVMLSDHGTIGGYPKIAVVISADYDKLAQCPPGEKIKFKIVSLSEAENLYKIYTMETKNIISKIK